MNKNYYKVKCKCGHVGRSHYIAIDFPVAASSGKEAAEIARKIPRCKHHHKDCILEVTKISYEEYICIYKDNNEDPYLKCGSIQEQRDIDISDRLVEESRSEPIAREGSRRRVFSGKTKIRNPKKFIKFNWFEERKVFAFE